MLPNHAPLVIAEQFGTLESLYPGRIDLGLGRAPGTDQLTMLALRRDQVASSADTFPQDVLELQALLGDPQPGQAVRRVPGVGLARAALDPRVEPLRRAARGGARPAVRVRVALRARRTPAGARDLSRSLPAVRAAAAAARDGRGERDRRRRRRGGARDSSPRLQQTFTNVLRGTPRTAAASDRRHRGVLDARGEAPRLGRCCTARSSAHPRRSEQGLEGFVARDRGG